MDNVSASILYLEIVSIQFFVHRYRIKSIIVRYPISITIKSYRIDFSFIDIVSYPLSFGTRCSSLRNRIDSISFLFACRYRVEIFSRNRIDSSFIGIVSNSILVVYPISIITFVDSRSMSDIRPNFRRFTLLQDHHHGSGDNLVQMHNVQLDLSDFRDPGVAKRVMQT